MKETLKNIIKKLPIIKIIIQERDQLHSELYELKKSLEFVPPGHFYSAIPSVEEIKKNEQTIFGNIPRNIYGIKLNEEKQLELFNAFKEYYKDLPFQVNKSENLRYFYENSSYSYSDAICLYSMIRYVKPKKVIEVGSGYSSCVTLDTNDLFFEGTIQTTFIEPFPELLLSLIRKSDTERITIIPKRVQDIDIGVFESLSKNDILFIDSTHVSKINSDVNYILFKILPCLNRGVYIQFHDIFYPFEYPKEWIYEGRAWNEAYILRAFLQQNESYRIVFFNTFLEHFYREYFEKEMPLCLNDPGGSIWIQKK